MLLPSMFRRKGVTNLFLAHQIGIEIILSHIPVPARGKDKKWTAARRLHVVP